MDFHGAILGFDVLLCYVERSATNRRLHSSEDVERLSLLREVSQAGYHLGQVVTLPADKRRERTAASRVVPARESSEGGIDPLGLCTIADALGAHWRWAGQVGACFKPNPRLTPKNDFGR